MKRVILAVVLAASVVAPASAETTENLVSYAKSYIKANGKGEQANYFAGYVAGLYTAMPERCDLPDTITNQEFEERIAFTVVRIQKDYVSNPGQLIHRAILSTFSCQ